MADKKEKKEKIAPVQGKDAKTSEISKKFKQNPALYIGSVFILVLVTVTFVGGDFLSGGMGRRDGDLTFGYYDKVPVSWLPGNVFAQNQSQMAQYYQSMGYEMDNFSIAAQIWRQAYEVTVTHTAVLQLMKRSNYVLPEDIVNNEVARLPQFLVNGRFSSALYNRMSESAQAALWRQVHDELVKNTYFSDYFFGMMVPSGEANFIGNMGSAMRSFEMVSFSIDDYPETAYLTFARENPDLFGTIHLSMITMYSSERDARRVLDSIRNGTITFEDAARAHSQDGFADRGGDLGSRYCYDLVYDIPNAADRANIFRLGRGEISNVIHATDRWVIFRVEEALVPADFNDETILDRVRTYVRNYDRGRMEDFAISRAEEFISDARINGFNDAVYRNNLHKREFGPLPINFGGVDLFTSLESFEISGFSQSDLEFLARNEVFWRVAFSAPIGSISEPMVQGNNVLVFFPLEQVNAGVAAAEDTASLYSSYWLNMLSEQALMYYFINNERMDDRFWETFFRYFL